MERASSLADEIRATKLPTPAMARAIREAAGVSQVRLAAELDVHRLTVARWETGLRTPRGINRRRYALLLAELQELIGAGDFVSHSHPGTRTPSPSSPYEKFGISFQAIDDRRAGGERLGNVDV